MTKLEKNLFVAARNSLNRWQRLMHIGAEEYAAEGRKCPDWLWDSIRKENARFKELLSVIRDVGLEEEFHNWRNAEQ